MLNHRSKSPFLEFAATRYVQFEPSLSIDDRSIDKVDGKMGKTVAYA